MAAVPSEAPEFTLDHILGHSVSLSDYRGKPVVVMFGGRDSAEQVKQAAQTIRRRYGSDELPFLGVSDLQAVPRPARIIAKKQLKKAYEEAVKDETAALAAAGQPAPDDPAKTVVMLTDWTGEVVASFGVTGVDQQAVGVLVDGDGRVLGSGSGAQAGDEILALLPGQ
jgi:cytochrome oxidase Cu insertion factor (SCO1/SenC/PrrC family)